MKTIHKQLIAVGVLLVLLVLTFGGAKNAAKNTSLNTDGSKQVETRTSLFGSKTTSTTKTTTTGVNTVSTANKEFPFSFTEKNLVNGTRFGEFVYNGFDYANYHKFTGTATISGQVTLVQSDGKHNLGLVVDKKDIWKLPQYYFESVKGESGTYNFVRANAPYTMCFGYYYPSQYDYNQLLDNLVSRAGQKVTVEVGNYKIIASKEHVGACASLYKIVEPRF